jgi:hypothetical protein
VDLFPGQTKYFFLVGGSLIFAGYYAVAVMVQEKFKIHFLLMSLIFFMVGLGSASSYHCSLATNYRNCPEKYRSTSVGLTVSFFGLSAFVFSSIGSTLFSVDGLLHVDQLLKFLATSCLILNLLAMVTLRRLNTLDAAPDEIRPLLTQQNIVDIHIQTPNTEIAIIRYEHEILEYNEEREEQDELISEISELLSAHGDFPVLNEQTSNEGIELENISCFSWLEAYILALNMIILVGVGLMYINNVGVMVLSLLPRKYTHADPYVQTLQKQHVLLLSLVSFVTRIFIGFLADFGSNYRIPKTFWVTVCGLVTFLTYALGGFVTTVDDLFYVTIFVAVSYGIVWTIVPILTGEYFGQMNFAKNWYILVYKGEP